VSQNRKCHCISSASGGVPMQSGRRWISKTSRPLIFYFFTLLLPLLLLPSIADTTPKIPDDIYGKPLALSRISSKATNLLNCKGKDIRAGNHLFPQKPFYHPPKQDDGARSYPECFACSRRASGQNLPSPRKQSNPQNNICRSTGTKAAFP